MRKPQLVVVMSILVASMLGLLGVPSRASACAVCTAELQCIQAAAGARYCVMSPSTCTMLLPCVVGGRKIPDGSDQGLTALTLFDAPAGAMLNAEPVPALAPYREAGPIALGEEARMTAGIGAPTGALADAELVFGEGFAISFVDAAGDGFAVRRSREGGRVRLEVRDVAHDVPGRVLASEALGPRDQLRVPVTVQGRPRVLLLHATRPLGAGAPLELPRLRRAMEETARVVPSGSEPLLHPHAQ